MPGDPRRAPAALKSLPVRLSGIVALAASLTFVAACADRSGNATMDSSLSRDLQMAGQHSPPPTFEDTALSPTASIPVARPESRPTPERTTPRPGPAAPAPARVAVSPRPTPESPPVAPEPAPLPAAAPSREIGSGTGITMTSGGRICSTTNRPGDKIVATIDAPVTGTNGAIIPAGSKVVLEVASAASGQRPEQSQISFRVRALYVGDSAYHVEGSVTPIAELEKAKVPGNPGADKKKVIGGAIAGAIIGQVLGRDTKSTVIGAATGAAAGTVAAKAGERYEGCVREGAPLKLTLSQPLIL